MCGNWLPNLLQLMGMLYALMLSLYVSANGTDDSSRVVLSVPNTNGTDYINASFVDVSEACTLSAFRLVYT